MNLLTDYDPNGIMCQRKRKRKEEPADLDGMDDAKKTVDIINEAPQEGAALHINPD